MGAIFSKLIRFIEHDIWFLKQNDHNRSIWFVIMAMRFVIKMVQDIRSGEIPRRATSLVYTTILTIVPLFAFGFSVLKGLGVHNSLEPFLLKILDPIGEKKQEIAENIIVYVANMNVKLLGSIGMVTLAWTILSTIQQIEDAFNYQWQVTRTRSFFHKFRDYFSVLLVGPLLIFAAMGVTGSIMSSTVVDILKQIEPFGTILLIIGMLLPYFMIGLSFTIMYYLLPNTKVRFSSAFVGGVSAGVLWQIVSWAFARFIASSGQYKAVYSGFAIVLLLMIWIYFNWMLILTGVKVSFYHQYSGLLHMKDDRFILGERFRKKLALAVMYLIGYSHYHGQPRWTLAALIKHTGLPLGAVQNVVNALVDKGLLIHVDSDSTYVPGRDMETITVTDITSSVLDDFKGRFIHKTEFIPEETAAEVIRSIDELADGPAQGDTLKNLVSI